MSTSLLYLGRKYVLENEEPFEDDEEETFPLSAKEQEAEQEIEDADRRKDGVARSYSGLRRGVDYMYNKYVSRYSTPDELRRLLRAVYEIIGKRLIEAKRRGDQFAFSDWRRLVNNIPNIFITPTMEGAENAINQMVETYYYVIENTASATSMVMAISKRLNELAEQHPEEDYDEIKEEADVYLNSLIAG